MLLTVVLIAVRVVLAVIPFLQGQCGSGGCGVSRGQSFTMVQRFQPYQPNVGSSCSCARSKLSR